MHISGTYKNTGVLPLWYPAVLGPDGTYYPVDIGGSATLAPGSTAPFSFTITAPSGIGYDDITVTPSYFGDFSSGSCSAHVPIYVHFQLTPHAQLDYTGTQEYPRKITYSAYVDNDSPRTIPAPSSSQFTYTPYGAGTGCPSYGPVGTPAGQFAPGNGHYTMSGGNCTPTSYEAGDKYCSTISLTSYNSGYVGPDGDVIGPTNSGSTSDQQCVKIVNEPYFKVYGTGVSAGGSFSSGNGVCTGGGLLAGYTDNADAIPRGTGSELSALALIKITGVASAQAAYPSSSPPGTALTFANTNAADISSSLDSPGLGGNYDPSGSHCLTDQKPKSGAITHDGPYTIGATNVGDNTSVFVNGDVRITGNIAYTGSWTIDHVPSFVLHATGNIYIDPGVTQLDGIYIAGKTVYTCDNHSFTPMPASSMYNGCKNQLVFNGSVTATKINMQRTFGSLRDERPTGAPLACSNKGIQRITSTCAAEIFNFSPELYLSTPVMRLPSNGALQYDAVTSLPPVL
jgi:hypothetical protein